MGKLIYSAIASLDGYVNDAGGGFEWAAPAEDVHAYVNDLERPVGTYLYGRRMYEVMRYWAADDEADADAVTRDFRQIWQAAHKVVFSRSLAEVSTPRTRLERSFDPTAVAALVAAAPSDVSIGGPQLAGAALAAGLVGELQLFTVPTIVGGGTHWLPGDVRIGLDLLDERRFASGVVYARYAVRS